MPADSDEIQIGNPAEWRRFADANPTLVEEGPKLIELAKRVFEVSHPSKGKADLAIYSLGLLIWEDFEDIFVLAANGRGFGAQKILRGMFERLVVLSYLQRKPEQADAFINWEHIRAYTMSQQLVAEDPTCIPEDEMAQHKADHDKVRPQFMMKCKCHLDCPHQVEMFTWHSGSFASLTWKAKRNLGKDLSQSYYRPLIETHATMMAAFGRMTVTDTGMSFKDADEHSRHVARAAIVMAYKYVLMACDIQIDHFADLKQHEAFMKERADIYNAMATAASQGIPE